MARTVAADDVVLGLASSGLPFQRLLAGAPGGRDAGPRLRRAGTLRSPRRRWPTPCWCRRGSMCAAVAPLQRRAGSRPSRISPAAASSRTSRACCPTASRRSSTPAPGACRQSSAGWRRPGASPRAELARTFNCGIGMVAVVDPDAESRISAALSAAGERVFRIGRIVRSAAAAPATQLLHLEQQWQG